MELMLLKKKKMISRKTKREELVYNKFSNFETQEKGVLCASAVSNCDCTQGSLKKGIGVTAYTIDGFMITPISNARIKNILFLHTFDYVSSMNRDHFCFITPNGWLGFYNFLTLQCLWQFYGSDGDAMDKFKDVDGKEKVVTAGSCGVYFHELTQSSKIAYPEMVEPILCSHKNRVFVAKNALTVMYNSPTSPLSFAKSIDDGGEITFQPNEGRIVRMVGVGDYLYIFFTRAIVRLYVGGKARNFKAMKMDYRGEEIVGDTVCALGKFIVFLSAQGIYRLNTETKEIKRICKNVRYVLSKSQPYTCSAAIGNKAYITYRDQDNVDKTLAIDPETEEAYWSFTAEGMSGANGKGYCSDGVQFYQYDSRGDLPLGEMCTFTAKTDFGYREKKALRSLIFEGTGQFLISVKTEDGFMKKWMDLSKQRELPVRHGGKQFELAFSLEADAEITKMTAVIERTCE